MRSNANATQLKRITDALVASRGTGDASWRGARTEQVQLLSDPIEHFAHRGVGEASYSANGYAIAGHGTYREPVAETFPLSRSRGRDDRNLQDMADGSLGPDSIRDRRRLALALASVGAAVWFLLRWAAENKADAFGWSGLFALIIDYWYPWTQKVAKLIGYAGYY